VIISKFELRLAGGSPAASYFLLLRQKKVTKEKATLPSPKPPKPESAGRAAQKLGSLFWIFKVSEPQTSTPLIRPSDSDFGGAGRGKGQKLGRWRLNNDSTSNQAGRCHRCWLGTEGLASECPIERGLSIMLIAVVFRA